MRIVPPCLSSSRVTTMGTCCVRTGVSPGVWRGPAPRAGAGLSARRRGSLMKPLGEKFSRSDLLKTVGTVRHENHPNTHELKRTLECIQWLADSNYELRFSPNLGMS